MDIILKDSVTSSISITIRKAKINLLNVLKK